MVRNLEVIKVARKDPVPDYPINFPPLENLHLELLENKKKLKPGLPLIPLIPKKVKPKPLPPPRDPPHKSPQGAPQDTPQSPSGGSPEGSPGGSPGGSPDDDEEMVNALKEDSESVPKEVPKKDPVEEALGEEEEEEEDEIQAFRDNIPLEEQEIFDELTSSEQEKYIRMSSEQRERYQKEAYIWKWRLLKRSYPTRKDLPEYNEHSDFHTMRTSFHRTMKDLQLEDNIESYRTYLVFGWIGIEYFATQHLGIDMSGFTKSQTRMMHKYEKLLIELGQRPYSQWGANLPVEVRLLGLILIQAGFFYLAKVVSSKFGSTVAEMFKGITGQPPVETPSGPKRKMRGPRTKVEDIRNMREKD